MKYIENNNLDILDALKEAFNVKSDMAVAKRLGVSRSLLSAIRQGRRGLSRELYRQIEMVLRDSHIAVASENTPRATSSNSDDECELHDEFIENRALVLLSSKGKCELCLQKAPFFDKTGAPYLIVKQIIPSKFGGDCELANLAALCPNCAAKLDVRADASDIKFLQSIKE